MRRILYAGCGLFATTSVVFLLARSDSQAEDQQPALQVLAPDVVVAAEPSGDESSLDLGVELPGEKRPKQLRDEYLELLRKKADLMTQEEIIQSLQELQAEIAELEAGRKLDHIAAQLRELIDAHPESIAAQRAQAMLNGLQARPDLVPGAGDSPYHTGEKRPTPVPNAGIAPFYHDPYKPVPDGGEPPRSSTSLKVRPIDETPAASDRSFSPK
jgi:hypothetical protein